MKRPPTEWKMLIIFANDVPNKELISKIYKEHNKFNIKKTTQLKNGQVKKKMGRVPE